MTKQDIKDVVKFAKENPKEATSIIAQAVVLTSIASIVAILTIKGATDLVHESQNRK